MLDRLIIEYERKRGEQRSIKTRIENTEQQIEELETKQKELEKAEDIVKAVSIQTQKQLEFQLASVVSSAQDAVFNNPYSMVVKFEQRRNKTECDLMFARGKQEIDPLSSSGYGAADIAAFALRISSWSMGKHTRPLLMLDEPFKHLKGVQENARAIHMMKAISEELGMQIITISDERADRDDIIEGADKVFEVGIKNGKSIIAEL
jgi:DNA repair exonuclease SbcCD ATPase subunit